jgi:hypothetical protein
MNGTKYFRSFLVFNCLVVLIELGDLHILFTFQMSPNILFPKKKKKKKKNMLNQMRLLRNVSIMQKQNLPTK